MKTQALIVCSLLLISSHAINWEGTYYFNRYLSQCGSDWPCPPANEPLKISEQDGGLTLTLSTNNWKAKFIPNVNNKASTTLSDGTTLLWIKGPLGVQVLKDFDSPLWFTPAPSSQNFLQGRWQGVYTTRGSSPTHCSPAGDINIEEVDHRTLRIKAPGTSVCPNNQFDYTVAILAPADTTYRNSNTQLKGVAAPMGFLIRHVDGMELSINSLAFTLKDKVQ
jgi:hypothetical protein